MNRKEKAFHKLPCNQTIYERQILLSNQYENQQALKLMSSPFTE